MLFAKQYPRVASKIWFGFDVQLYEFYWFLTINNGGKNVNIIKSDLRHIIFEKSMPENLKKGHLSITYGVVQDIFSIVEDSNG